MRFQVLGPVEIHTADRPWGGGSPQQRLVLAALAIDAGSPVSVETLVDRVWDRAPDGARRTVYVLVTSVRRLLREAGAGNPVEILRRSSGYVLDVSRDEVDLYQFRGLVDRARDHAHDPEKQYALLREAVSLWRGEPLAGLPGEWAARTRDAWREEHLEAVVAWTRAACAVGDPTSVLGTLADLTRAYPLVESLVGAQMRALVAAGRPADALDRYQRLRERLAEELGTEPEPDLRALHLSILQGDPGDSKQQEQPERPGQRKQQKDRPAQLPGGAAGFVGRAGHLARLDALLVGNEQPHTVVVTAIAGTAGVGKTALALHWAHRVADQFPDGQLYVNLRGFDPSGTVVTPAVAVRGFLDALGVPAGRIPSTLDDRSALYRSLVADKRILVVLDNARDAEQVRPLLPATPTCLAVVTSRDQLTSLVATEGAHPVALDLLSPEEARELLIRRVGADRVAAEPDAVDRIVAACARLPLALAVTAARARQTNFPLARLAAELADVRQRLDVLDTGDPVSQVRAVFSWSYDTLSGAAARVFRLLGLHPGPDTGVPAAASLAGLSRAEARRLLAELVRANLVMEHAPGRYACHDLLRAYAVDLTERVDSAEERHVATGRLLDHYLHSAYAAAMRLHPGRTPLSIEEPGSGVEPEVSADHDEAMAWFDTEHRALIAVQDHAVGHGWERHTWQIAWTLNTYLYRRAHWSEWVTTGEAAVAAAERLADPAVQAHTYGRLAYAYSKLGRPRDAEAQSRRAIELYRQVGDRSGEAYTEMGFAVAYEAEGRYQEALEHTVRARALYAELGQRNREAEALNNLGWIHIRLGQHVEAVAACRRSLALFEEAGDRWGQAHSWDSLGLAHFKLAQHAEAIECYRRSVEVFQELEDRSNEATILDHLGDAYAAAGDPAGARESWERALAILAGLTDADLAPLRTKIQTL